MSNAVKKILYFFLSFLWVIGAVGSLGYILWMKEWVIAIGLVIVIVPSVPKIKEWVKFVLSNEELEDLGGINPYRLSFWCACIVFCR